MLFMGLNPNAGIPRSRRYLESVAAGNISSLSFIFNRSQVDLNTRDHGLSSSSMDVIENSVFFYNS